MKTLANKVKLLNENVDKQSQNTDVEGDIVARQKSKARSRLEVGSIVQNNLHICRNLNKRNLHKTRRKFCSCFETTHVIFLSTAVRP